MYWTNDTLKKKTGIAQTILLKYGACQSSSASKQANPNETSEVSKRMYGYLHFVIPYLTFEDWKMFQKNHPANAKWFMCHKMSGMDTSAVDLLIRTQTFGRSYKGHAKSRVAPRSDRSRLVLLLGLLSQHDDYVE